MSSVQAPQVTPARSLPPSRRRSAALAIAAELTAIFVLSTAPTPLYVIYQQMFRFPPIVLTLVYAVYVVGAMATMFFLGRLSDQVGRKPVVLASLGFAAASCILFLFANSAVWLFPARILSGLAIAMASGASTAWIVELWSARDRSSGTRVAIVANQLGLGLGCLVAGVLAQLAPWPLRLVYGVCLALILWAAWLTERAPETVVRRKPLREASLKPRFGIPREGRRRFAAPAIGAFAVFAVLGFYSALLPTLLSHRLKIPDHAVAGLVVAEIFVIGAAGVALSAGFRRRGAGSREGDQDPRKMMAALASLIPAVTLFMVAAFTRSLWLLAAATALGGVSTGQGFFYCLSVVNELAPGERRSEIVSLFLIVCYFGISLPVIGVGILAEWAGELAADSIFAGMIVLLTAAALVVEARIGGQSHGRRRTRLRLVQ